MSRVRLALFRGRTYAEAVCQRLAQAGIHAEVHDELGLAKLWFVSRRSAGARLEVRAAAAARAQQLLMEWSAAGGQLEGAIHCPECASLHIAFPQHTQKSLFTNLAIGLVAELGLIERQFYCESCHCMWSNGSPGPHRQRAHMAPNYFIEDVGPKRLRQRSRHA
ncbi:MAG TPA: hypothetical protein VL361_10635 [Candidatus Limnocylindrales bacterium]|nr:hypothetical protein [Candidatus Limnocylindrales bacterium]